jgi:hypothetical protein
MEKLELNAGTEITVIADSETIHGKRVKCIELQNGSRALIWEDLIATKDQP